jgi:hypothetical protein
MKSFESIFRREGGHYNIFASTNNQEILEIEALKEIFPEGKANELNFCLFGTSGVHGSYGSVEGLKQSVEKYGFDEIDDEKTVDLEDYTTPWITFLVIHPRLVCLRYGNVRVTSMDDIAYLEKLRDSSAEAVKEFFK